MKGNPSIVTQRGLEGIMLNKINQQKNKNTIQYCKYVKSKTKTKNKLRKRVDRWFQGVGDRDKVMGKWVRIVKGKDFIYKINLWMQYTAL